MTKNKKKLTVLADNQEMTIVKRKQGIGWFITKVIQGAISGALLIVVFQIVTSFLDAVGSNTEITSLSQISTITAVNVFVIYVVMNLAWKLAKKIFNYDLSGRVINGNVSPEMKQVQASQMSEAKTTVREFVSALGFGKKTKKKASEG